MAIGSKTNEVDVPTFLMESIDELRQTFPPHVTLEIELQSKFLLILPYSRFDSFSLLKGPRVLSIITFLTVL
jgi:hypothetical protein